MQLGSRRAPDDPRETPEQLGDLDELTGGEAPAHTAWLDPVAEQLIAQLAGRARASGLQLAGEGGLLGQAHRWVAAEHFLTVSYGPLRERGRIVRAFANYIQTTGQVRANRRLSLLDVSRRRQWQARAWCCRPGRQVDQWRTASRLVVGCRATWRRAIDQVAALVVAYARTRLNIGHRRV